MTPDPPLASFVRAVGVVSVALAAAGVARPRSLTALGGVAPGDPPGLVPLLVRLGAARQGVVGLALLTRRPPDVRRSSALFLPLTAVDCAVVLLAVRNGVLRRRAAVASVGVLAANCWVSARARG